MRSLFLLVSLLISASSFGDSTSPWQKYIGCYNATLILVNGKALQQSGTAKIDNDLGVINSRVNDLQTGAEIPAINITVWRLDPAIDSIIYVPVMTSAFNDRGSYTSTATGDHYQFNGSLGDWGWDEVNRRNIPIEIAVQSTVDISTLPDQSIKVSFSYNAINASDNAPFANAQVSTVLTKVACCDPSTSLCQPADIVHN